MPLAMPLIVKSEDLMEAYMIAPPCNPGENYTLDYLNDCLRINEIKIGILTDQLEQIIEKRLYGKKILVAKGAAPVDGKNGYFEYMFNTELNNKPVERENGSVDYKNTKMIELVEPGQVIAVYHHATKGTNGYNLAAQFQLAKSGVELPPLRGTGFECMEDGVTYKATTGGKITEMNDRVNIFPVHELYGDVDLSTGNIDFNGDVIIHGNVREGMTVKCTGTVTVDKIVENATIDAKKGIVLRGGVLGSGGAQITSRGDIAALFIEYAHVRTEGNITADSFLDSHIYAGGHIHLSGKKGCIVGGTTHAVCGVSATAIGNDAGANTEVTVGVHRDVFRKMNLGHTAMVKNRQMLEKIEIGLRQLETMLVQQGLEIRQDPRYTALVKEKIRLSAEIAGQKEEESVQQQLLQSSMGATIEVVRNIYVGTKIGIDEQLLALPADQHTVAFRKRNGHIIMESIGYTTR